MSRLNYLVLSLAATFCVSANPVVDQEIAMMKCSRDREYYHQDDCGRPCSPDQVGCGNPRRYADDDQDMRREYREDRRDVREFRDRREPYREARYQDKHHGPRCCGQRSCYPDANGRAGYTLDSAGRRRCVPASTPEYKIDLQGPCDSKGNCKESAKLEQVRNSPQFSEVTVRRKSAAQKVLEGY
jgi:hypothetical protein